MKPAIMVKCDQRGWPVAIRWRSRLAPVRVLDAWEDVGAWWAGEGEKVFFRVELRSGPLMELYRDTATGGWQVYRVYD